MNKQLVFSFLDNNYTINFPNNGEFLRIQNLKVQLAPNKDMLEYIGAEGQWASSLVDVEAHLSVLCPELIKSLVKPIRELDMSTGILLVEAYSTQFRPWYNENLNFLFKVKQEVDDRGNTETESSSNRLES